MYNLADYDVLEKLGSGSFGSVYKARNKKTLATYAIKIIDQQRITSSNAQFPLEYIQREVAVLKKLSHPNIVGLMDYSLEGDNHILAMEYCSGATLDQYITKRKIPEDTVRSWFKQLAAGMKYMWSKNIIHRDLKPQNILFSSKGPDALLKIIDFGFSRIRTTNLMTSIVGTPIYMAPELLRCQPYTAKIDLWSIGCILYEMLTGSPPFICNTHVELMQLHASWTVPTLPPSVRVSAECVDMLNRLLCADPVKRIEWNDFFAHPFIASSNLLTEATIAVHIEPLSRSVTLNTQDLDAASLVSAFKAQMLADGTDDQEKYEGVAALLECNDGSVVELLDSHPISYYAEQFSTASTIYLVLPLNKESVPDIALEPLNEFLESSANATSSPRGGDETTAERFALDSSIESLIIDTEDGAIDDHTQLQNFRKGFGELAEELRESVRGCREAYERCGAFLAQRGCQFNALKASMVVLEEHRKNLSEMSVSFKKTFQEPQELAIQTLPAKVEAHIEELRNTLIEHSLPGLQGKSLLDCVGEHVIRRKFDECRGTLAESARLMASFDMALQNGYLDSRVAELFQKELNYNQQSLERMYTKLQPVEVLQVHVEHWCEKVDEHLRASNASWLGFSFEEPLREALTHAQKNLAKVRASAAEVHEIAARIAQQGSLWPWLVAQFRTIANARASVFSALRTLHVCGEQYYLPQQRVIEELRELPQVMRKMVEQAHQVLLARNALDGNIRITVQNADEKALTMRNDVLEQMKRFHNKFDKQTFAKSFLDSIDALQPPVVRVVPQASDDALREAFAALQAQNAQLRNDLQNRTTEVTALRDHARDLTERVGKGQRERAELARDVQLERAARSSYEQRVRALEEHIRRMQSTSK